MIERKQSFQMRRGSHSSDLIDGLHMFEVTRNILSDIILEALTNFKNLRGNAFYLMFSLI